MYSITKKYHLTIFLLLFSIIANSQGEDLSGSDFLELENVLFETIEPTDSSKEVFFTLKEPITNTDLFSSSIFNPALIVKKYEEQDKTKGILIDKTAELRKNKSIILTPSIHVFLIHISLTDNFFSAQNGFAFKIKELDSKWHFQKEDVIQIPQLPYGNFTLLIRARRYNGQWINQQYSLPIEVCKPVYFQEWFLAMLIGCILVFGFWLYKKRVWQLKAEKDRLEDLVKQRTYKIEEDKIIIQRQNEALQELNQTKDKLFTIIAHDLRDPANTFIGLSKKLQYLIQNKDWVRLDAFSKNVDQAAGSLHKMLNNLLFWASTQSKGFVPQFEYFCLNDLIKELFPLYQSVAAGHQVVLETDFSDTFFMEADKENISIIIRNLLDNAIKFSNKNGIVHLNVFETPAGLNIVVKDEGIGISKEMLPNLFKLEHQVVRRGTDGIKGAGLGLILCKELTELNHGKISVQSIENQGTEITLIFPFIQSSEFINNIRQQFLEV